MRAPQAPSAPLDVVLHIGLPKTGTSFLQNWLAANRRQLADQGIHVPARPILAHRLAVEYLPEGARKQRSDVQAILQQEWSLVVAEVMQARAAGASKLLLSSEYFWLSDTVALSEGLAELGCEAWRIVACLRRQDRLMEAGYNQEVKAMNLADRFPRPRYHSFYDWRLLHARWREAFPAAALCFRNYDLLSREGRLLEDFLEQVQPGLFSRMQDHAVDVDRSNESLSAELLEAKRLANELGAPELLPWLQTVESELGPATPFRMAAEDVLRCYQAYEKVNRWLDAEYPQGGFREYSDLDRWTTVRGADYTDRLPGRWAVQLLIALRRRYGDVHGSAAEGASSAR